MSEDASRGSSAGIWRPDGRWCRGNIASIQWTGRVLSKATLRRRGRIATLKRIVRAHVQRLDGTRRRTLVIVPATEVGEAELGGQTPGRRPLSPTGDRRRCKLRIHWRCSRGGRYGYRDGTVVEAPSCACGRGRAGLRYRRRRRVVLREDVAGRRAQGLRYVLAVGVGGRVRRRRRGQGLFMSREVLCACWMDGHVRLLGRVLHAWPPVASPLLGIVWGSHWRAGYGRRGIRRGRGVRERGEGA